MINSTDNKHDDYLLSCAYRCLNMSCVPDTPNSFNLTAASRLSLKIKAEFFLAGMLGLHGNIRSLISAIKSIQGNVKSPVCQSPSPHWVDCVTRKPTGTSPLSFLWFPLPPTFSPSRSVTHAPSLSHVFCHMHTFTHTDTNAHIVNCDKH